MAESYSHSRIETFEQCRLKFKYRYIDKIIPEIAKSIEAHLGSMVHETLEWLYTQVMEKKIPTISDVVDFYSARWQENYTKDMKIVNQSMKAEDYFQRGVEFLINYFMKHHPFKDNTIAIEKKIELNLDGKGEKRLVGYIDRLVHNLETDEVEIHDYKTSNSMWSKEKLESNRQLALYSLAIKESFGKEKKVCMVWHFLAHDMKVCLRKTNEQLELLREEVIAIIDEIENTKHFPGTKSRLCDWCEYRNTCEAWGKLPPSLTVKDVPTNIHPAEQTIEHKDEELLDIW